MIVPRYVPGDWVAVVSDGMVALLPSHVDERTVERLWASLREGDGLGAHLDVLMERGLSAVPPFALVSLVDGDVHAIVRGDTQVLVDAEDGEHELDGSVVTTWHEATVRRARTVQVRAVTARVSQDVALPVLSAVVRAAAVDVELVRDARPSSREERGRAASARTATQSEAPVATDARAPSSSDVPARAVPDAPARAVADEPAVPASEPEGAGVPEVESSDRVWAPEAVPSPASPPPAEALPGGAAPEASSSAAAEPADQTPVDDIRLPVGGLPTPAAGAVPVLEDDDHDGLTVQSTDVASLRRQLPEWAGDEVPGPLAVPAPSAPPPAKIHLSSGLVIALNRPVLLGRAPQVSRVQNSQIPRLVTVASPNQDISRTHAEVRQDGEHVLVTDLRSTNGVLLLREGTGPQRLHPGEPTVVEPGVVVDLGEGVTFLVEHGT